MMHLWFRFVFPVAIILALAACRGGGSQDETPEPTAAQVAVATTTPAVQPRPSITSTPAATASATPAATPAPTAVVTSPTPTVAETPSPEAAVSPSPIPTPTPDPAREPVAWYIDDLRQRTYNGCCIERVGVYEQTDAYTSWVIAYQSEDLRVTGLMAIPNGDGPFPVAIINHGYFAFDDYDTGWDTLREVRFMASNGYVAIAPDYRNYAGSDEGDHVFIPGYVYDVRNLLVALHELPEADPERIGMMGHSMGGGITLQNIVSGANIKVAALFGTVTADEAERWDARINRWSGGTEATSFSDRYGTPSEVPEVYARMSVSSYWDAVEVPVIIHHGDADTTTPIEWAYDIEAGLAAAGKQVEMHVYPGAGHSFNGVDFDLVMSRTLAFFDAVLRPAP